MTPTARGGGYIKGRSRLVAVWMILGLSDPHRAGWGLYKRTKSPGCGADDFGVESGYDEMKVLRGFE